MREYEELGHMQRIHSIEDGSNPGSSYYLPHHAVFKESSTTTKLRVVFDASARTSSGVSLNNCLMVGPKLQDDILPLIMRFRTHIAALTADITKMYRQFVVAPEHADYQRVVWRESVDQPIQIFKLLTVTYGTSAAPYLATKCLQQLALDEMESFPIAAPVPLKDFYVDDLMSGESSEEAALILQHQLIDLLSRGQLQLRKWSSNSSALLQSLPPELRDNESLTIDVDRKVKTLGLQWHPDKDHFSFSVSIPQEKKQLTKRIILSELSKIFDPMGWLSPVTLEAKSLIQQLWKLTVGWDDTLASDIQDGWRIYQQELQHVQQIYIPRCIVTSSSSQFELHGFWDASLKAYAAVIYLRSKQESSSFVVRMLIAKTRVAPLKQISIPRLELCGAVLLSKLVTVVKESISMNCPVFMWTDSTIVLQWLSAFPNRWNTFVANRVAEIQGLIPREHWHHVKSECNPADCASRGLAPSALKDFELWWNGPSWLVQDTLPVCSQIEPTVGRVEEERTSFAQIFQVCIDNTLLNKYSSLVKLKRITAYCLRFIYNVRPTTSIKRRGSLTTLELNTALLHWVKQVQTTEFKTEATLLRLNKPLPRSSSIHTLHPYLDGNDVLRVGGRLEHSNCSENFKNPALPPKNNTLTAMIIQYTHVNNLHAGSQLLLATLQRDYWIIRDRDAIRFSLRKCVICRRQQAQLSQQMMGSLPAARVQPSRPFIHCGVDYTGPFNLLMSRGRGRKVYKGYISVFVCFSTKAIHLEAVTDLTSDAFIAALHRFTSRRGRATDMYSDCGTNFVGANHELIRLLESSSHNDKISHMLSDIGTNWHFNPPASPHHGGLWEAGVKSIKYHLRRIAGNTVLTFEEFQTMLAQIEACLNSRPLCAMSSDPSDLNVLTPGHFLIGAPLTSHPEPEYTNINVNRLSKWQQVQQMYQHFWKRWSAEYLSSLQQRFKWTEKRTNLQLNDIVIIKEDSIPPMKWKMGRIVELHAGNDTCVRVVSLKTSSGIIKRPIVKLCPLISNVETE